MWTLAITWWDLNHRNKTRTRLVRRLNARLSGSIISNDNFPYIFCPFSDVWPKCLDTTLFLGNILPSSKHCHRFHLLFHIFQFIVFMFESQPPNGPSLLVFPFFTSPIRACQSYSISSFSSFHSFHSFCFFLYHYSCSQPEFFIKVSYSKALCYLQ